MDTYLTEGQARRIATAAPDAWQAPVAATATAPAVAASPAIGQLHLVDVAAMEAAGDGSAALVMRASILHESADGEPVTGATLVVEAPGVWFDADPHWHVLDLGADEGWALTVEAARGRAVFTFTGALSHGGSTGVTARLGLEPGTRIAGHPLTLTAWIAGAEGAVPTATVLTVA